MVETHWDALRNRELRYADETWRLTGDVDARNTGEVLAVGAVQTTGGKGSGVTFYFDVDGGDSLNPGALADATAVLDRDGGDRVIAVTTPGRDYRYVLNRLAYN